MAPLQGERASLLVKPLYVCVNEVSHQKLTQRHELAGDRQL